MAQYIYGKNVVKQRILNHKKIHQLLLSKTHPAKEFIELAKEAHIPVRYCDDKELSKYEGNHQGVIAEIDDYKVFTLEEVLSTLSEDATIVLLDGLEDPHNLGAILRTADAGKVDAIVIPKHGSVQLNGTVAKVSTGAIETVKTISVVNMTQAIETLKKHKFWVYGSEFAENAVDYRSIKYQGRVALVVGSEGRGISRLVLKNCDQVIKIPMYGEINSLNASVSAALLIYEVLNQRNPLK